MYLCLHCNKNTSRPKFCCNKCKDRWHNRNRYIHIDDLELDLDIDTLDYASGWDEDGWRDDDSGVSFT